MKLREVIRLKQRGVPHGGIGAAVGLSRRTIIEYIKAIDSCGLTYSQLLKMEDEQLADLFIKIRKEFKNSSSPHFPELLAYFPHMDKELKRHKKTLTIRKLWEEYLEKYPDGLKYSRFCHYYQKWRESNEAFAPFEETAGDKLYVDFTGKKLSYIDPGTGEIKPAEVFVATLGASQFTYIEATPDQSITSFFKALENALWFFGGIPLTIVPDNFKAAVKKAGKHEPDINDHFADFARHYDTAIIPTRPGKPKDKPRVEGGIPNVYYKVYAAIRNKEFTSLEKLNKAIHSHLPEINDTNFQNRDYSRSDLFKEVEKEELNPLPVEKYEIKYYKRLKVAKNVHIMLSEDKHYYSVPSRYVGERVLVLYSESTVEIYFDHQRIAFHKRDKRPYKYSTIAEHMPSAHRFVQGWSPGFFESWAKKIGPQTHEVIKGVMASKKHPEQGYRSCMGILHLEKKVGRERLEKACKKAHQLKSYSYKWIKDLLKNNMEALPEQKDLFNVPQHENIRDKNYYQN